MTELERLIDLLNERLRRALAVAETLSKTSDLRDVTYIRDQIELTAGPLLTIELWAKATGTK